MRNALLLLLAGAALAAAPLAAQVRPTPGTGDPRVQSVVYNSEQIVLLQGTPGYQITIELSPDEQVETVAVGDSAAWQVTANRRGDLLFVKALQDGVATNMTVVTTVRLYNFELVPLSGTPSEMAYTVRFRYPLPEPESPLLGKDAASAPEEGRYRLGGDKALRPSEISDDGSHTYIRWPPDRTLPAVYAIADNGGESLVNGMMRNDVFVVDSVARKLVFRIDNKVARAERVSAKR